MKLNQSPVTSHQFNQLPFYLKRDDLLHPQFSGNKARKFMALLNNDYEGIEHVVGYGSVQANSLYSLAALCHIKGWKLHFYVDHIPSYVKQKPIGNYQGALKLGADIIDLSTLSDRNSLHASDYIEAHFSQQKNTLIIPEGGRSPIAEQGVRELADEILKWQKQECHHNLTIALPSGTGTTALYLQKHLESANIDVLTCACVGNEAYLIEQFEMLEGREQRKPTILGADKKHQFGRLNMSNFQLWEMLKQQTNVEFDLLYDPFMWQCLLNWLPTNQDKTLLYIHQGGLLGNESMFARYQRMINNEKMTNNKKTNNT